MLRAFFFILIVLSLSCEINRDIFEGEAEDVATRFVEEHYKYKDHKKVKKYFHPNILERIDDRINKDLIRHDKVVMKGWSKYEIRFQEKRIKGNKVLVVFKVKGIRRDVEYERTSSVTLMLDVEKWKVVSFS